MGGIVSSLGVLFSARSELVGAIIAVDVQMNATFHQGMAARVLDGISVFNL